MLLKNQSNADKLQVQLDLQKPLGQGDAAGLPFPDLGMVKGNVRLPSYDRDQDVALQDQYRRYKDKTETQEKVRVISEDFIDDIINRRQKMGLRGESANGSIGDGRYSQQSAIERAYKQNERTRSVKPSKHIPKVANVASLSAKGRTEHVSQGKYSYNQTQAQDVKTASVQKNKAMQDYRSAISGALGVLQGAQRTPIQDPEQFKEQVGRLKQQLAEVERVVELDQDMALKYPGSTGNGDAKLISIGSQDLASQTRTSNLVSRQVPYSQIQSLMNPANRTGGNPGDPTAIALHSGQKNLVSSALVSVSEFQNEEQQQNYTITKKQAKNLEKIFVFYTQQHMTTKNQKCTFDELGQSAKRIIQSDFLKFCKDFALPLTRQDQMEIFRKKAIRRNSKVDFEVFHDILKECFFVKETEELIRRKQREIKVLDESNLRWSMEQKQAALKAIEDLQQAERDTSKDPMYFWQAHQYLQTHDAGAVLKKLRSIRIPFQGTIDQGEKLDNFSHEPYDQKQRIIPSPRMGAPMAQKYEHMIGNYFAKKEQKQKNADKAITQQAKHVIGQVQENRKAYENINSKSKFGKVQTQFRVLDSVQELEFGNMIKKSGKKNYPTSFQELGQARDVVDQYNNQQRTSWTDLREINFKKNEEHDLKVMLGIPLPKYNGREGLGGGGNSMLRKELSLGKLETQLVASGVKRGNNGRSHLSPVPSYLTQERPSDQSPALKQSHSVKHDKNAGALSHNRQLVPYNPYAADLSGQGYSQNPYESAEGKASRPPRVGIATNIRPHGVNKAGVYNRSSIDSPPTKNADIAGIQSLPQLITDAESTGDAGETHDSLESRMNQVNRQAQVRSSLDYEQNLQRASSIQAQNDQMQQERLRRAMQQYDQKVMNLKSYNLSPPSKSRLRKGPYGQIGQGPGAMEDALGSANNSGPTGGLANRGDGGNVYGLGSQGSLASLGQPMNLNAADGTRQLGRINQSYDFSSSKKAGQPKDSGMQKKQYLANNERLQRNLLANNLKPSPSQKGQGAGGQPFGPSGAPGQIKQNQSMASASGLQPSY